jgi:glycine hydroxymethyltransferase
MITSGIRLGSPAGTTRGFGAGEFRDIGKWIVEVVDAVASKGEDGDAAVEARVRDRVIQLCNRFPIYQ